MFKQKHYVPGGGINGKRQNADIKTDEFSVHNVEISKYQPANLVFESYLMHLILTGIYLM